MTNDIREKAEALVKAIQKSPIHQGKLIRATEDLKAALRPSRQEIAGYLETYKEWLGCKRDLPIPPDYPNEIREYLKLAIEELRK